MTTAHVDDYPVPFTRPLERQMINQLKQNLARYEMVIKALLRMTLMEADTAATLRTRIKLRRLDLSRIHNSFDRMQKVVTRINEIDENLNHIVNSM